MIPLPPKIWSFSLAIFLFVFFQSTFLNGIENTTKIEEKGEKLDEKNESGMEPPSAENNFLRLLGRKEKKEILRIIGNGTAGNGRSRAEIEASIRGILARNNSNGALSAFDKWMDRVRDWRERRFFQISANLSSEEAKNLLTQVWTVMKDKKLSLVESCRRVKEMLGKWKNGEEAECRGILEGAEFGLEGEEEKKGRKENGKAMDEEEDEEEEGTEIFDGNEFNELHHEAEEPGSRQEEG